jgi:hypothetical protein
MVRALLPFLLLLPLVPAQVSLPSAAGQRFVDFSEDFAHSGAIVAIGTLSKWKEGKRERLADGQLGGAGQVTVISGTQYFKVPVTAALQPRTVLHGKADSVVLGFDVQLARLPDGKEQRQTKSGMPLAEDTLALFVVMPRPKKGFELRHVIVFDKTVDQGKAPEATFADTMRDYTTVNRRKHDLTAALARVDGAADEAGKTTALAALRELVAKKPELKQPQNDGLLQQHVAPLEQRATKRLAEADRMESGK